MYSKQPNNKGSKQFTDVNVGTDKGTLRLQFSTKISQQFYGKRQAYKALGGRKDTPDNRQWAEGIARRIQEDIDYQNGVNFDPTLAKYLDIKPLATVTQLPTAKPLPKLRELWEEFSEWKLSTGAIEKTTYENNYLCKYPNLLKPYLDKPLDNETALEIIKDFLAKDKNRSEIKSFLGILSGMCQRAVNQKILPEDYFLEIKKHYKVPKKSKQLSEAEDYRAYTIEERDLIIDYMRNHQRTTISGMSDIVEFLFLTGCRHGEAFALKWEHIKLDTGWIIFKEAYDSRSGITKGTKTDVVRMFKMKGMNRLINLLTRLYGDGKNPDDLVFKTKNGSRITTGSLKRGWQQMAVYANGSTYKYPGAVTELAEKGKLQYLKPYSTRHTFISIQANNGTDLKLLADSCGNSVDVIIEHYLDSNRNVTLGDF
ncbi:MAG: tyrosine-type recombinase/integrase [Aulosira sp. ZfuVER01]|nr:site-specific integrase [Aulosira sp. ZfuVER01]MDZ7998702.1 site-specific integrase [Aulosira sp. DedVER01a]MDZ8054874.1 site-specific integrase [Aulosira sp. ZfuCHP01]